MRDSRSHSALAGVATGIAIACGARSLYRRWNTYDFAGRNILITGGSRGLGLVIARLLCDEGARIFLCARDQAELDRAETDLRERGADVTTFVCDVTSREDVTSMVERIDRESGPVDVVINNAGVMQFGPDELMTRGDYDEAMATHFRGPLNVVEAVLPSMRVRRAGRIVNIASIGGRISVPHMLPYCTSKFALVGYSLGLRAALAEEGITVTTICPGLMRTGSPRNIWVKGRRREEYAWFKVSGSLPVVSISCERAARQVVDACRHGEAFRVIGAVARVADNINALFPGLTANWLGLMHRMLPSPEGHSAQQFRGYESESALSESFLTTLTQQAGARNNELHPPAAE